MGIWMVEEIELLFRECNWYFARYWCDKNNVINYDGTVSFSIVSDIISRVTHILANREWSTSNTIHWVLWKEHEMMFIVIYMNDFYNVLKLDGTWSRITGNLTVCSIARKLKIHIIGPPWEEVVDDSQRAGHKESVFIASRRHVSPAELISNKWSTLLLVIWIASQND